MRTFKGAIIAVICLSLLTAGYFLLPDMLSGQNDQPESTTKIISFYNCDPEKIVHVAVKNMTGEYAFTNLDGRWTIDGYDVEEPNQEEVGYLVRTMSFFDGEMIDDSLEELEEYGLNPPMATLTLKMEDGTVDEFYLGLLVSTGTGYYLKTNKDDNLYVAFVNKAEYMTRPLGRYRESVLYHMDPTILRRVSYQPRDKSEVVVQFKSSGSDVAISGWEMVEPVKGDVYNDEIGKHIIDPMNNPVMIESYVTENPTDYEKYGLVNPESTVTFVMDGNETTLLFGKDIGDSVYVKKSDKPIVYLVNKEPFEFRKLDPMLLVSKLLININIADVKSIDFEFDGKKNSLHIEDINNATIDGKSITKKQTTGFYESFMLLLNCRGIVDEKPSGEPSATIKLTLKDGSTKQVNLVSYKERYYAATVDDTTDFYILKGEIEMLFAKLEQLLV